MEDIIRSILATKNSPFKVGKVYEIRREEPNSDICKSTFVGISGKSEYFIKFDIVTKEILVLHKNIRKKDRDDRKRIKEEFWKKWNPSQFCAVKKEDALKFELFQDLDKVVENSNVPLDEIDWTEVLSIGKFPLEREP
jgi:hypothetical protein